ncbi:MAG: 1-acyl-sn-glycerol-3-phosphate acyltransferase [Bacteroidaceae bacterium]|nr:1-acyl-sn-glycerol-3-phosphate acyltransferase [Bacteroidaceae bacterium]
MSQQLSRFILYKLMGWKTEVTISLPEKYIIALAPHTSNWDFLMGQLYSRAEGFRCDFMMKKEWFFWPLGPLFRKMGGIPVERSKHTSLTDQMAKIARESTHFGLCITPEGTRKPTREWKKGFYYIALKAELPILLFGLDYKQKRIVCTKCVVPNGNLDMQMQEIKQYFSQFQGKIPANFVV